MAPSRRPSSQVPARSMVMSEVREQLSMPGAKDESENTDENDVDQRSIGRSVTSSKSFRSRKKPIDTTESPTPSRAYWNRSSSMKNYADSGASVSSRSSWKLTKASSQRNNQIVADFFDVQSLASEPGVGGRRKTITRNQSAHNFETRSVTSKKSVGSTFLSFFFRMRNVNDELDDDMDNLSQFYGSEMLSVDDEELTLGSGLNSESGETIYNDDTDESSVVVKETIRRIMKSGPPKEKKASLLGRIMQRRKEQKAKKQAKKEEKARQKAASNASVAPYEPKYRDPSPDDNQSLSASKRSMKDRSVASTVASPSSLSTPKASVISESAPDQSTNPPPNEDSEERPTMRKSSSCRWSGDPSVECSSSAPKPPVRRRDSAKPGGESAEESAARPAVTKDISSTRSLPNFQSSAPKIPKRRDSHDQSSYLDDINVDPNERSHRTEQEKAWRENVRREMALRKGKDFAESKEEFDNYHDDSDESVLSLLSGLLATWSAERDGGKGNDPGQSLNNSCYILKPKRSILKTSDTCFDERPRYSVVFDSIIIREYERTVGDNPSCSRGPPISIGWSYVLAHEYPIDDYELLIKAPKRSKKEFHLSADIRTHLLMEEWACSEEEIRKARREVTYIQYCRAKSSFSGVRNAAKEALFLRKGAGSGMGGGNFAAGAGGPTLSPRPSVGAPLRRPVGRDGPITPPPRLPRRNVSSDLPQSPNSFSRHPSLLNEMDERKY